ncbi:MAG: hypothetical protein HYX34_01225 [Actinobacteria bacterium]|nr:hypothetical protein [Actinomycetota bacterium]
MDRPPDPEAAGPDDPLPTPPVPVAVLGAPGDVESGREGLPVVGTGASVEPPRLAGGAEAGGPGEPAPPDDGAPGEPGAAVVAVGAGGRGAEVAVAAVVEVVVVAGALGGGGVELDPQRHCSSAPADTVEALGPTDE